MPTIKEIIRDLAIAAYKIGSIFIPVKDNVILFESSNGRNYTGNPKYIYEEMVRQGLDKKYKCIWSFQNPAIEIPGNGEKIKRSRFKFLYYSRRSKFWIFDSRHQYYLRKNKKTKYIQTWHGTPLKKLALDMEKVNMSGHQNIEKYRENFAKNTSAWDYLISQNSYSSEIFKRAFAFDGEMLEIGYPRNDILINENNETKINEIKNKLGIDKNKKIILYAPTWRDNEYYDSGVYKFATEMDFNAMKNALSDDYVLIVKFHYLVKDKINWEDYGDFVIECNEMWDIQELYLISDILITDYSSVMFDYALLNRPILFFTYDMEFYKDNLRDFYFDINTVPGPLIETTDELVDFIKNNTKEEYFEKYGDKYQAFKEKYNEFDDGKASENIIKLIKEF